MERRSAPIITLSLASSSSLIITTRLPRRAASRAPSLTRLARSAPEKPGVPRAITRGSTAGAQQRRIQHVGPVGGGDQDHAFIGFKAVHLDQQLVEGLFAFVIAAAQA